MDKEISKEMSRALDTYVEAENELWQLVKELPNFNGYCDCNYPMRIQFDTVAMKPFTCLRCGGRKDDRI